MSVIDISTINEKQAVFFKARERYVAYGGARGGGKSWSVQRKSALLALFYAGIKILLLRRTYKDLERNHVRELKVLLKGVAVYNNQQKLFTFPNGSIIELGYCASESDVLQYQGQEYDIIFIDEATQFTEYMFETLTACNRGANDFPHRMYLTCNPGGVGHEWVKRLFVKRTYRNSENAEDYKFIQATVYDNKVLLEKDPEYVKSLENLSPGLREMWLLGDWDVLAGAYFSEFDRNIHVVKPFEIPSHWRRYRGMDYGLDCLAVVWMAVSEDGTMYIYREYAESDKAISVGAGEIIAATGNEHIEYTAAPRDMWHRTQESAKAKADLFRENGLPLVQSSVDRESGWLAVKDKLQVDEDGSAKLYIFDSCINLIEHLPALQRSNIRPNDCMTEPHDITHLPDALRYLIVKYINPSPASKEPKDSVRSYRDKVLNGGRKRRRWM